MRRLSIPANVRSYLLVIIVVLSGVFFLSGCEEYSENTNDLYNGPGI